ncbi:DUF3108 domain-containing protein [Sinomicrobium weinanense]|uniref:DUF3108 domain-containing protein n=1 Tax=Sinomicrobium weinanense TaxID=2842200 RepID=A0A926JNA4_9FLAO|nr:DUF3108 domain-containing protein [Sinomicrobium weinanense]MBC9794432.1 DUF3108 domain-containing protein [Sinomicrobium weinanense]MBU3124339.1 DUF3108 domain-containing protein [Sinomicrobium weinanense]
MRKIVLTTIFFCLFGMLYAQNGSTTENAFAPGEWLQFRVHYGIFNASYATMEVRETSLNGKPVFHVVGLGKTTGLARLFFKVDDNYETYFDKHDGRPYKFIRQIDEGGYTKDMEINFDYATNQAVVNNKKHKKTTTIPIHKDIQDLLSAVYHLRNHYKTENLNVGDETELDLLFDDDKTFKFKLKFLGKEVLKTKFGKISCIKFRPYVQAGRVFKEKGSLTLWVSDDENKLPIRIKADLRVGSIKADLEAFKGLKHEFKVVVK